MGVNITVISSVGTFSLGALISGFSPNLDWLVFWRLVAGMGIGAEISLATTYLGELFPFCRGRGNLRSSGKFS